MRIRIAHTMITPPPPPKSGLGSAWPPAGEAAQQPVRDAVVRVVAQVLPQVVPRLLQGMGLGELLEHRRQPRPRQRPIRRESLFHVRRFSFCHPLVDFHDFGQVGRGPRGEDIW